MLGHYLSKTDDFQKTAVVKRLQNLLPKYRIRESQKFIRRCMGGLDDSGEAPADDSKEDVWTENFLIRKNVLNRCGSDRSVFESKLLTTFFKRLIATVHLKQRNCFLRLGGLDEQESVSDAERFHSELGLADEEQFEFEDNEEYAGESESEEAHEESAEEHYGMPKIEETFEESVEDSRMDSPIRKMGHSERIMDSQIFGLKLSKIQKMGEEHRFIDADHFNFTSNETGAGEG